MAKDMCVCREIMGNPYLMVCCEKKCCECLERCFQNKKIVARTCGVPFVTILYEIHICVCGPTFIMWAYIYMWKPTFINVNSTFTNVTSTFINVNFTFIYVGLHL